MRGKRAEHRAMINISWKVDIKVEFKVIGT